MSNEQPDHAASKEVKHTRIRVGDDFLTITEIAKVLKVSRATARRRHKPGPITWDGMTCK